MSRGGCGLKRAENRGHKKVILVLFENITAVHNVRGAQLQSSEGRGFDL